ncbi:glycosyltransferase family 4 protein [Fulvivirga sedimenti]|uniref:Glycosyltransferase family 4 protein n=1 Tax=Fulvivirga sedimenti TaxID=2879465 RepID=A0A9X1HUD3_9BACT|nr:glycosyltransferase family 4 protein [Fulvivirga sedimenti]MCA6078111.1 glycosyltransferase family 4 protein [Fulvivirga sedimenti]
MTNKKKILFLLPYQFDEIAGQRFRCEHFYPLLREKEYQFEIRAFYDAEMHRIMYKPGHALKKGFKVLSGFIRRIGHTFKSLKYDYVFIYRELTPIGPPFFEWVISKVFRKKIIFDFDDALWLPDENESAFKSLVKCKWKIKYLIKWSSVVSCGNPYLAEYAARFNVNVTVLPTVVNTRDSHFPRKLEKSEVPVIGWTGSHSTLIYLDQMYHTLEKLRETKEFNFKVICNKKPPVDYPWLVYKEWTKDTEIEDLSEIDIGIMPLAETMWSEGKCGFKIIQYLALEIPAVASPVGINQNLIKNGENGYLCSTQDEWMNRLGELLDDPEKRKKMGIAGRKEIIESYSVACASPIFLSLFE